jgi:hypothetical protein
MKRRILNIARALLISVFCIFSAVAQGENLFVRVHEPLVINVVAEHINRINFQGQIVRNIWGDMADYSAAISTNGHDLFFLPKKAVGEEIQLKAELMNGQIIDLVFKIDAGKRGKILTLEKWSKKSE